MIGDVLVRVSADISDFTRNINAAGNQMRHIGDDMQQAGYGIATTFGSIAAASTVAIGATVKAASDYESAFAGVRKTVDGTEADFQRLSKGIIDMSKRMPESAEDIAAVAESAGQLGIKTDDIMGFTETMVMMGTATNMSSTDAAEALARLANITQMPQDEFDRLGSTVVALGNNLAATETDIVNMGLRIAGAGNTVGMTEDQILSFAGALSSVGIEAEMGGSAISRVMIDISSAVMNGGKDLDNFAKVAGMSSSEFKEAFEKDAATGIIAFIEGLGRMQESGQDTFGVLDELGLSEIRVRDTLLRAAGAGDLFSESLKIGSDAWKENTALTDEAAERYKTFDSQLTIFLNKIKDIFRTIGGPFLAALTNLMVAAEPLLGLFQKMAEWFANSGEGMQTFITAMAIAIPVVAAIVTGIGLLMAAIGTIVMAIGTVVVAFAALSAAGISLGAVVGGLALIFGGLFIIIPIIVGLIALIVIKWDEIKAFTIQIWTSIVDWLTNLWLSIVTTAVTVLSPLFTLISTIFTNVVNAGREIFSTFVTTLSTIWNNLLTIAASLWTIIKNAILGPILLLIDLATGDFEGFASHLTQIWTNIKTAGQQIWTALKSIVVALIVGLVSNVLTVVKSWSANLSAIWNAIKSTATSVWNNLKSSVVSIVSGIVSSVVNFFSDLVSGVAEKMTSVYTNVVDLWNDAKSFLSDIDLTQIGKDIIQGLINGIGSMAGAVATKIADVAGGIKDKITGLLDIHSPSRWMRDNVGKFIPMGIAVGIDDMAKSAIKSAESLANNVANAAMTSMPSIAAPDVRGFERSMNGQMRASANLVAGDTRFEDNREQVVEVPVNIDGREVFKVVSRYQNREYSAEKARRS